LAHKAFRISLGTVHNLVCAQGHCRFPFTRAVVAVEAALVAGQAVRRTARLDHHTVSAVGQAIGWNRREVHHVSITDHGVACRPDPLITYRCVADLRVSIVQADERGGHILAPHLFRDPDHGLLAIYTSENAVPVLVPAAVLGILPRGRPDDEDQAL